MKDRFFMFLAATIIVGVFVAILNPTPVPADSTAAQPKAVSQTTAPDASLSHKG